MDRMVCILGEFYGCSGSFHCLSCSLECLGVEDAIAEDLAAVDEDPADAEGLLLVGGGGG